MTPQEQLLCDSVKRELGILRSSLNAVKSLARNNASQPVSLRGQYIRKPIPARIGVEIHSSRGNSYDTSLEYEKFYTTGFDGKINIDSGADFVATGFFICFKFDDGCISTSLGNIDISGMWRHASSIRIPLLGVNLPLLPIGIQDLWFEYEVSRTHQFRQNIPVPSCLLTMSEEGNGLFPLVPQDIFPAGEIVSIRIKPTHPLWTDWELGQIQGSMTAYPGSFWCGFNGFYVLGEHIPTNRQ